MRISGRAEHLGVTYTIQHERLNFTQTVDVRHGLHIALHAFDFDVVPESVNDEDVA